MSTIETRTVSWSKRSSLRFGPVALAAALLVQSTAPDAKGSEVADVSRTQYGVVHVEADSEFGLAYGLAHAYASDNVCLLADFVVTVNGERSRYFGAAGRANVGLREFDNLTSDRFFKYYIDDAALREAYRKVERPVHELIEGFVAGYNAYLAEHGGASLPRDCRNAAWVRPITNVDMYRMLEERAILSSGSALLDGVVAAAPSSRPNTEPAVGEITAQGENAVGLGSNGWAFGADVTANGRGVLLANPHFPWETINRFYQVHLRLRGRLDVMGVMLPPFPVVSIGFNRDVAWTHTVSTAKRFTLFELQLAADDPLVYLVNGARHRMTQRTARVQVREPDGRMRTDEHTFYETMHGPVISLAEPQLRWTTQRAYALQDVNRGNTDMLATWLDIGRARKVAEIEHALAARRGVGWVNTIATDRHGTVLFADLSRVPNVSGALIASCRPSGAAAPVTEQLGIVLLDGAREACLWHARGGGDAWLPVADLPVSVRKDYVANSNDSYWLVNAQGPLPQRSPILGPTAIAQRFRTRIALEEIEHRLGAAGAARKGHIGARDVEAILFSNRTYSAELVADDLLALCRESSVAAGEADVTAACVAIAQWDRRSDLDSRGAALFREFWSRARVMNDLYAVPFDPSDPVRTPRGLNLADPVVRKQLRAALAEAADALKRNGFAVDVRLGDVQGVVRNGRRIPIHGGDWYDGVLNLNLVRPLTPQGYVPYDGASYIQIVEFGEAGPVARGVLAYSQSVDPQSAHYADQTELYSRKQLYRLPFTEQEIRSDSVVRRERLNVARPARNH